MLIWPLIALSLTQPATADAQESIPEEKQATSIANETPEAVAEEPTDNDTKLICRKTAKTGSLIQKRRVCLTRVQWDEVARDGQGLARSMLPAWTTPNAPD
jgi:hypothetical protein